MTVQPVVPPSWHVLIPGAVAVPGRDDVPPGVEGPGEPGHVIRVDHVIALFGVLIAWWRRSVVDTG